MKEKMFHMMEHSHKMKINFTPHNQVKMSIVNLIKIYKLFKLLNVLIKSQILK